MNPTLTHHNKFVIFTDSSRPSSRKSEEAYTKALSDLSKSFDQKFEKSFGLKEKGICIKLFSF